MASEFLKVTEGLASGKEIQLDGDFLIGRSAEGDGTLGGDAEISREHARVSRSGSELLIEDLGSTNGTIVNGQRIAAATPLRPGDIVKVGTTTLQVEGTAAPAGGETVMRPGAQPGAQSTAVRPRGQPTVQRTGLSGTMLRLAKQPEAFEETTFVEEDDPPGRHPTIIAIATVVSGILIGGMIAAAIFS
jgi:pSer/pThr/pTyr-binding forkhead associated (FHA) protein